MFNLNIVLGFLPFVIMMGLKLVYRGVKRSFTEYALQYYSRSTANYFSSISKQNDNYSTKMPDPYIRDRVIRMAETGKNILSWKDGDSFLEFCCGYGGSTLGLAKLFPLSQITCSDRNAFTIYCLKKFVENNKLITASVFNVGDVDGLRSYKDNSFDHIFISHGFHYIYAESVDSSIKLRQDIVNELVRIAKKSVVIQIDRIQRSNEITVEMINSTFCFIRDDITRYFVSHYSNGILYGIYTEVDDNDVLIFIKNSTPDS